MISNLRTPLQVSTQPKFQTAYKTYLNDLSAIRCLDGSSQDDLPIEGFVRCREGELIPTYGGLSLRRTENLGSPNDRVKREYMLNEQTATLTVKETRSTFDPVGQHEHAETYKLNMKTQQVEGWNLLSDR